ncbi:hypothetical protein BC835DRAFT_1208717, partial [Cytidiella melzeri]
VVDSSGIAEHTFHFCTCRNAASQVQQLLEAKLFPASYEKIKTGFSFKVLDDYMLESTACQTSGNAFWSKLQCRTDNAFTSDVPDRYREFFRVSRCWRYLQIRKWFGVGYSNSSLKEGELALFCAACPQPGINMPAGWKTDSCSWLYWRSIAADGFFSADHLKAASKSSSLDVPLSNGEGYMTERSAYKKHLNTATE